MSAVRRLLVTLCLLGLVWSASDRGRDWVIGRAIGAAPGAIGLGAGGNGAERLTASVSAWRRADDAWWVAFNRLGVDSLGPAAALRRSRQGQVFTDIEAWTTSALAGGAGRLVGEQGESILEALLLARREGQFRLAHRAAVALSDRLRDEDPAAGPARLARALGALDDRDTAAARVELGRASALPGFAARDYAAQRLSELELAAGDTVAAGRSAELILAVKPPSLRRDRARTHLALLQLRNGQALEAARSAETLLAGGMKGEEAAGVALIWLRAHLRQSDEPAAAVVALRLFRDYPATPAARTGWTLWQEWSRTRGRALTADERLAGGTVLLRGNKEDAGRALLVGVREGSADSAQRVEAWFREAEWLFGRRRWDEARVAYAGMEAAAAGLPARLAEARLGQARCYRNSQRPDPMLLAYRRVESDTARSPQAATALWETGREMKSLGRYAEAESALSRYIRRHPYGSDILSVLAARGFVRLTGGRPVEAGQDFRLLQTQAERRTDKEQGAFWAARCALARGARQEAIDILRAGLSWTLPDGYYGYRMRGLLKQLSPEEVLPSPFAPVVRTEYGNPLAPQGIDNLGVRARAHFERGVALGCLGLAAEAQLELARAADLTTSDPGILATVAGVAARLELYTGAMSSARRALARTSSAGEETRLWRHVYALAHFDLIAPAAQENGLDPMLVTGLIRQESLFDERAYSRAGARGLMQLMLPTARQIARSLGDAEPDGDDLFQPELSVTYGTHYLRRKLAEFDNRVEVALAAYNAGESKAREWQGLLKTWDPDLYIEQIGYAETRDYVRRVRYNQATYQALYGNGTGARLE